MNNMLIRVIKCPKCNGKNFNCYDVDEINNEEIFKLYHCEDCEADFNVKFISVDIELEQVEDDGEENMKTNLDVIRKMDKESFALLLYSIYHSKENDVDIDKDIFETLESTVEWLDFKL